MTTASGRSRLAGIGLPALAAYVPLLLTQRGQVGADTKTYLYLDPARLLSRAPYLWDEHIGAGTITHQNIGYLWPMGPWYWLWEQLGAPDWVAQRLWLGTVMVTAALGVRFLLGDLGWQDGRGEHGVLVASMAYMLSPYVLDYAARISVILLPWAGLPWLVALGARALREGGWRWPAWFALVTLTVGGINATALVMVAPAVALWFFYAVFVTREATGPQALATLTRMGVLTLATSLWWMAGLWAQGSYGLPVLRFTETYRTVAESSSAPEVLRGLGYWFFYGRDKLGPWIEPSVEYTNRTALLALSYLLPTLALAAAAVLRWRHRAYFLVLAGVGGLMAVAAHPWHPASPMGALFKVVDPDRHRVGSALYAQGGAPGDPGHLGVPRGRSAGIGSAASRCETTCHRSGPGAGGGEPASPVERHDDRQQPQASRGGPQLLGRGRPLAGRSRRRDPRAWRSPDPTSPATAGATRWTRSRPAFSTAPTWHVSSSSTARLPPPAC